MLSLFLRAPTSRIKRYSKDRFKLRPKFYSFGPSKPSRPLLAIETSCDDTAVAIVTSDRHILGELILKQDEIHLPWKGIVPRLAGEAHANRIDNAISEVMKQAKIPNFQDLDAVAFTRGPGLSACLAIGLEKVKQLSTDYSLPIVGINHMEGHALAIRFENPNIQFPYLALLVSGGHSQILVVFGVGDYKLLGETLDIAMGDAFDKVARVLDISVLNGGQALEDRARQGNPKAFRLPLPMQFNKNCDMSFSGIQTAVTLKYEAIKSQGLLTEESIKDLAAVFQYTAISHVIQKVLIGLEWSRLNGMQLDTLVVSGGVACNTALVKQLEEKLEMEHLRVVRPSPALCRDNAVMIAWAAQENLDVGKSIVEAEGLRYIPRWPLDETKTDYFPNSHPSHTRTEIETAREESLAKCKSELLKDLTTSRPYIKAVRLALKMQKWDDVKSFLDDGIARFPQDAQLPFLKEKYENLYSSWRNKYA